MTCLQSIRGFRQSIIGYSAPLPNWRDDWFWLSTWFSHGECTSVYGLHIEVSYDLRLSNSHDLTKLLHYVVSQPYENIELVLKLVVTLTYG